MVTRETICKTTDSRAAEHYTNTAPCKDLSLLLFAQIIKGEECKMTLYKLDLNLNVFLSACIFAFNIHNYYNKYKANY